jgi:DNA-binding XRE family transcriptional regulator
MDLVALRTELGLSQQALAAKLGVKTKSAICDIEAGRRQPGVLLAVRIEKLSGGRIKAEDLNPRAAELRQ